MPAGAPDRFIGDETAAIRHWPVYHGRLNDPFRRDCDRAIEHVLDVIAMEGGDRREAAAAVDRIMTRIAGLRVETLPGRARLPKASRSDGRAEPG